MAVRGLERLASSASRAFRGVQAVTVCEGEARASSQRRRPRVIHVLYTVALSESCCSWNEWTELVQSCCIPYFTEVGFKVVEAPSELARDLQVATGTLTVSLLLSRSLAHCYFHAHWLTVTTRVITAHCSLSHRYYSGQHRSPLTAEFTAQCITAQCLICAQYVSCALSRGVLPGTLP